MTDVTRPANRPASRRGGMAGVQPGHQLLLLQGGAELFPAMVEAMDAARQLVHLETYIF